MQFDILTIFPESFDSYVQSSIIHRAIQDKKVQVNIHDIRSYATDKHNPVDDTPYSGGAGMLLKIEPIYRAVLGVIQGDITITQKGLQHSPTTHIALLSAKGKQYTQKIAHSFTQYQQIILICGRYEGVDERVAQYIADAEICIGKYVLTGGELPAMVVMDSVARLVEGVVGNKESLSEESFQGDLRKKEYPQYTRPAIFSPEKSINWQVPPVLYSGDHQKIKDWKQRR